MKDVMESKVKDADSDLLKYLEFEESLVISEENIENTLMPSTFLKEILVIGYLITKLMKMRRPLLLA